MSATADPAAPALDAERRPEYRYAAVFVPLQAVAGALAIYLQVGLILAWG